jgi:hypothetical protein
MIKLAVILLLAVLLLSVFTSVSYMKKASAAECPSGQIKDWAGICFNKSEAKACLTCAPGSAAAAEKPRTSPKVEPITIPPLEKSLKSTSPPRTITIPAPNECTKPPCTVTVQAPKEKYATPMLGGAIFGANNPHSLKNLVKNPEETLGSIAKTICGITKNTNGLPFSPEGERQNPCPKSK